MTRWSQMFFVLIFGLFFLAGNAYSAPTHKAGSDGTTQKGSKRSRLEVSKKAIVRPAAIEQETPKYVKKKSLKSRNAKVRSAKKIAPEAREATIATKNDDEYIEYRLGRGETLDKVAERFNVDKEEIVDLNQTGRKRLSQGSVVLIPRAEEGSEEEPLVLNDRPLRPWKNEEERGILVKVAKSFAGAPYRYGGDTVRGLDCSAFVKKMYEIFEVQLPRSAREQYCAGPKIDKDDLATGDLVFFRTKRFAKYPTHVGIYIGDDKFIHSSSQLSGGVKVDCLSEGYFARTYTGAVRIKAPPATDKTDTNPVTGKNSTSS
jgi:peptidoglycan DL-endopeptidase LytE